MNLFTRSSGTTAFGLILGLSTLGCGAPPVAPQPVDTIVNTQPEDLPPADSSGLHRDGNCLWTWGDGKQIYTKVDATTLKPSPEATVFEGSGETIQLAHHFFPDGAVGGTPAWDFSLPAVSHVERKFGSTPATLLPAQNGNLSWVGMQVNATPDFEGVTMAYRLFTSAGATPAKGVNATPKELEAPYTAWYVFCKEAIEPTKIEALKTKAPYGRTRR